MTQVVGVYVGQAGYANFEVGVNATTWGWQEDWPEPHRLRVGDLLVIAQGGGGRMKLDEWMRGTAAHLVVGRITRTLFRTDQLLWPDEKTSARRYPYRIEFELVGRASHVRFSALPRSVNSLMQTSATKQGRGFLAEISESEAAQVTRAVGGRSETATPASPSRGVLSGLLQRVLELQSSYSSTNTPEMQERGMLIRKTLPDAVAPHVGGFRTEGRDGTGRKTHVPWVRVYDEELSPSATSGFYLALLFAADGQRVALSLNQGTTDFVDKEFRPKPPEAVRSNVETARALLAGRLPGSISPINLAEPGGLGEGYEYGHIAGWTYESGSIPSDTEIRQDLLEGTAALRILYEELGQPAASTQRTWIFQAKPTLFNLLEFLHSPQTEPGIVDDWLVTAYADQIRDGDRVMLWSSGEEAGVYALGTIQGEIFQRPRQPWQDASEPDTHLAIKYRLERVLAKPVLRRDLLQHPVLKDLLIIRRPSGTNFPVTEEQWEALREMVEKEPVTQIETPASPPTPPRESPVRVEVDLEWLQRETLWSQEELMDVLDTLQARRPQVALAGPPGTGKTWVAERIGLYLTGGRPDAVRVVQFHPTYSYEDFVIGLRPVAKDGAIVFEPVEGPLLDASEQARRSPHPVVLIVDEMNRANLPSVFGELLYLLEYRGKPIRLLHRDDFSLPPNLYIIGTMNTADRSIRSVDTALRRRFDIFDTPPRPDILDRYYESSDGLDIAGLADGLRRLNERLAEQLDRHHTIGHSFLMGANRAFTRRDLDRTWRRQIEPLIEEYFFDQPDLAASFTLESLWPD